MARHDTPRPGTPIATASPSFTAAMRIGQLQQRVTMLAQSGQPRLALQVCREILALQPHRPDVLSIAGTLALRAGDREEAVALYRRALAQRPEFAEVHYNLGNALSELGRLPEAAAAYGRAVKLRPDFAPAHHNLGNTWRALGDLPQAVEAYRRALAVQPNAAGERDLGIALHDLGRHAEAVAAFRRSLALPGHRTDVLSNLANALLEHGDAAGALAACEQYLALAPADIEATALKALALNELGDRAGAGFLMDFDRFVQIVDFAAPPPGFAGLAEFNTALVRHVEAHPSLKVPPQDDPTYHSDVLEVTGELFAEPRGPMAGFEALMAAEVARYIATVPQQPAHPFPAQFPKKWRLTCWATRLKSQGNLDPHVHFSGYIGGVYYPLLPDIVARQDAGQAGWFELGRPPARFALKAPPLLRQIQPKPGRLLLFPGYFFHDTVPFTAPQTRISIAFDVVREG